MNRAARPVPRDGALCFGTRSVVFVAIVWMAAAVSGFSQTGRQIGDFAGTWKAEFHKQTWMVLTLNAGPKTLTGTLAHSTEISSDDEGDITKVSDDMSNDKVVRAELRGQELEIETEDEDQNRDRYTLTLTGTDTADLQPIVANEASPHAFKLKRVTGVQK